MFNFRKLCASSVVTFLTLSLTACLVPDDFRQVIAVNRDCSFTSTFDGKIFSIENKDSGDFKDNSDHSANNIKDDFKNMKLRTSSMDLKPISNGAFDAHIRTEGTCSFRVKGETLPIENKIDMFFYLSEDDDKMKTKNLRATYKGIAHLDSIKKKYGIKVKGNVEVQLEKGFIVHGSGAPFTKFDKEGKSIHLWEYTGNETWRDDSGLPSLDFYSVSDDVYNVYLKAQRGDPSAQYSLGLNYAIGSEGLPKDYEESYVWFSIAASLGWVGADKKRDAIVKIAKNADKFLNVDAAQARANNWLKNYNK